MKNTKKILSAEKYLRDTADLNHQPISGTFELLPICNMQCSMCYVRQSPDEVKKQGGLLSVKQWIQIGKDAADQGMLFLLLTGGEPFLFPDFSELYHQLHQSGIVISINSNGTLINETAADRLAQEKPRIINITVYGSSDQTYLRLCGNPSGFTQMSDAVRLLKEREIPLKLNCSVTPDNLADLPGIYQFAKKMDLKLDVTGYMFPPHRINASEQFKRLSPKEAALIYTKHQRKTYGIYPYHCHMKECKEFYRKQEHSPAIYSTAIPCRAASSSFWINWKGQMLPCGMFTRPAVPVSEYGFSDAWRRLQKEFSFYHLSDTCANCSKKKYCITCAASALAETGQVDGIPLYQCQMTDEIIRLSNKLFL